MESKSQAMEKVIDGEFYCQRLLHHDIISSTMLDLFAFFIIFIIGRWIDNKLVIRLLFLPSLLLPFLFAYLLDKLLPKYITLIQLSYIYISVCKSILSILKTDFSLVTKNIYHTSTMVKLSLCSLCQVFTKIIKTIEKLLYLLLTRIMEKLRTSLVYLFSCIPTFMAQRVPTMENPLNPLSPDLSLIQGQTTMEKFSNLVLSPQYCQDSTLLFRSVVLISFTFIIIALEKFFPKYLHYFIFFSVSPCFSSSQDLLVKEELINNDTKIETVHKQNIGIKRGEVGFLLSNIGISLSKEGDQIKDCMSHEEFSTLFDQIEPGLNEVEEAFSVFDQNRDGFIDAKELQMVLINLRLREGTDIDACQSMIDRYDHRRKGKIDLRDFFKLVESALL